MCGIAGIVSKSNISSRLFKALLNLEYRGYDSCGIAVVQGDRIEIRKDKGSVQEVDLRQRFSEVSGLTGIGHTRWATTGIPNKTNAHPHMSSNGKFALVHNGIINNYQSLREQIIGRGGKITTDTDTETIVELLALEYDISQDLESALRRVSETVHGTYAIAFVCVDQPDTIVCARQESPLIIGIGDGENFIGSDHNAFLEFTRRIITLFDGEYALLNRDTVVVKRLDTGVTVDHEITWLNWDPESSKKGGFPHYMLKEIHEQPNVIETVLRIDHEEIVNLAKSIGDASRTYLIGVGTTFYVSMIAQYFFSDCAGRFLATLSSDEFSNIAEIDTDTLVIAFSQSGETYDTLQALRYAKKRGAKTAAVINVMGSTMMREVDIAIMQGSGPEICVLSTKAALAQIIIAIRISLELGLLTQRISRREYDQRLESLKRLPDQIRRVINESKGLVNNIARKHAHLRNWLFIGRGVYSAVALEAALKMKEVTYQHAEGIPGGFMKHGTIALIEDGVGSVFFVPPRHNENLFHHTIANAEEIKARKGFIVGLGFGESVPVFDEQIILSDYEPLTAPLLLLILGQLLAYYSAVSLNRNVDKPRSLAKSVTVA